MKKRTTYLIKIYLVMMVLILLFSLLLFTINNNAESFYNDPLLYGATQYNINSCSCLTNDNQHFFFTAYNITFPNREKITVDNFTLFKNGTV